MPSPGSSRDSQPKRRCIHGGDGNGDGDGDDDGDGDGNGDGDGDGDGDATTFSNAFIMFS